MLYFNTNVGATLPCFKPPRRPIHGLILRRDPDHPNLASLFAKRIPKPPMRGSPHAGALLNCPNGVYNAARCRQ